MPCQLGNLWYLFAPPASPPLRRCCNAVEPFLAAGCASDPTLLSILPGVGVQPAGLNSTLSVLEQACGI